MKYIIEVPDEMLECGADEALEICINDQLDCMYDDVEKRLSECETG